MILERIPYYAKRVINNYDDPFWRRQLIRARLLEPAQNRLQADMDRIHVMEEDWDNLIVLDACRADLFQETVDMSIFDDYETVKSAGSNTTDWSVRNFSKGEFGDTVYVSGSPVMPKVAGDSFHHLVESWEEAFDEEHHAIMPEPIAQIAQETVEEYPNKRLVVHFLQPHVPFIPTPELNYNDHYYPPTMQEDRFDREYDSSPRPHSAFDALAMCMITREEAWNGYRQNLEYVMNVIYDLVDDLPHKTIVTSDHGNMLGERAFPIPIRLYGHPKNLYCPELVEVPWATVGGEQRREITDDGVLSESYATEEERKEKLRYLGYIE